MPANFYQRLIDKYEPMTEAAFLVLVSVRQWSDSGKDRWNDQ